MTRGKGVLVVSVGIEVEDVAWISPETLDNGQLYGYTLRWRPRRLRLRVRP